MGQNDFNWQFFVDSPINSVMLEEISEFLKEHNLKYNSNEEWPSGFDFFGTEDDKGIPYMYYLKEKPGADVGSLKFNKLIDLILELIEKHGFGKCWFSNLDHYYPDGYRTTFDLSFKSIPDFRFSDNNRKILVVTLTDFGLMSRAYQWDTPPIEKHIHTPLYWNHIIDLGIAMYNRLSPFSGRLISIVGYAPDIRDENADVYFFSPGEVERIGRKYLLDAPLFNLSELGDGGLMLRCREYFLDFKTDENTKLLKYITDRYEQL